MSKIVNAFDTLDISTRPKRRKVVSLIVAELERIRNGEEAYMLRIPESLQNGDAYGDADNSVSYLTDAICSLSDAY